MKCWALVIGYNQKHAILLVFFVSLMTLFLSTNNSFADVPDANAGANQTVNEGATVTLDGTGSTAGVTYKWAFSGSQSDNPFKGTPCKCDTFAQPTFTASVPKPGNASLEFSLIVTNGDGTSTADTITVLITGTAHKHNFTPDADGKFNKGLGQVVTGKAFGVKVDKPEQVV